MTNPVRFLTGAALVILSSCATPNKPHVPANPDSHKLYQSLDANKDGRLSYSEFLKSPIARKSRDPEALFARIDTSHDGYITFPEWRDYRLKMKYA